MTPLRSLLAALALVPAVASAYGQGALTPPGAPAPTMKTLDQVEARTPISALPYTISADGSYYLTGNLTVASGNGIVIFADNVTLDLNGFSVGSTASPAAGAAINCAGAGNVVIRHGSVRGAISVNPSTGAAAGTGFQTGVQISGAALGRIEDLQVNGATGNGISLSTANGTVSRCQTNNTGLYGIYATNGTVDHCVAVNAGQHGIYANVASDCEAAAFTGTAIHANQVAENCQGSTQNASTGSVTVAGIDALSALNCRGQSTASVAVNATVATNCVGDATGAGIGVNAKTARGCSGTSNGGTGLVATVAATDCNGDSANGSGISTGSAANCFGHSGFGVGIFCQTALNCVGSSGGTTSASEGIDCGSGAGVATGCYANAGGAAGYSIRARLASGCTLGAGQTTAITNKVNVF